MNIPTNDVAKSAMPMLETTDLMAEQKPPSLNINLIFSEWLLKSPTYASLILPIAGSLLPPEDQLITTFPWNQSPLNRFVNAFEVPLINTDSQNWEMVDPDLIASTDDWMMMWAEITRMANMLQQMRITMQELSYSTFSIFRLLAECAGTAYLYLPDEMAVSFYMRAKKALILAMEQPPTLATVQACNALSKGQPVTGISFLRMSLDMILELRLDVDPDDSPWLFHLNLTPRQKEDRRRAFWSAYWQLMWLDSNNDGKDVDINCDRIKAPGIVMDPEPVFEHCVTRKWECELLAVIGKVRRHYATPPKSVMELLQSGKTAEFKAQLESVQTSIPREFLLISESPATISLLEEALFVAKHVRTSPSQNVLASLKSCEPRLLFIETQLKISDSITQCFNAALRIINLFHFSTHMFQHGPEKERYLFDASNGTDSYFESVVVMWFLICRMNAAWWSYIPISILDYQLFRTRMGQLVDFLISKSDDEENGNEFLSPVVQCLIAMLEEIDYVQYRGQQDNVTNVVDDLEGLELGMQVLSIGASKGQNLKT
ncbi:hypothetical protein BCR33DRAFT_845749 [Rhizoclosmatium globosum]|uniref:Transcription factor domain-containing protein n=1 Tax=Rhizoclosmatium globosum TaxID=329046 RepID=A0A1Y2D023_9FUNG|nr:hypothetical protein BCR33DRAFT_845749 [Rhizoclosmatium globosum]|eukprot:ORY52639.1 hypothetical protein BCR33DRAFT_845749 [Rhizoclosmatium globosum]